MSTVETRARGFIMPLAQMSGNIPRLALRLIGLALLDAFAVWFLYLLIRDGVWPLVVIITIVTLGLNIINLREDLFPLRWLSPGLTLLIMMALYPIIFTIYTAFTNYSDGHLLTKLQVIHLLAKEHYLPEGAQTYSWVAYRGSQGDYILWLTSKDGENLLAVQGEPVKAVSPDEDEFGPLDEEGIPVSFEGYRRLTRIDAVKYISELGKIEFGEEPNTIKISSLDAAAQYQQRYVYDDDLDAIIDRAKEIVYSADNVNGAFTSSEGASLLPGYQVPTGLKNFKRLFTSPALRGPFAMVFMWTVAFAFFSVATTFALGLFLALIFDDPQLKGRKIIRSLLIIPYAIPGVIGILIWRGMLNPHLGVVSTTMKDIIGWAPPWLSNAWWSKIAILLVNLWLGYPYMMLITSGALQAIPHDLYEAARVDGATAWQRFWNITLPLLLVSVGPLLIASFTFNFNNFNVIYLFNEGGPPIPATPTPAGHTDILISYTYRLAFAGHRGSDYGYAAAITIVIFLLVSLITIFNFRYTRIWEEISESV
ncbi:MAG: maltose ABC transporter permease MalF [Chloroflexota bacterium]